MWVSTNRKLGKYSYDIYNQLKLVFYVYTFSNKSRFRVKNSLIRLYIEVTTSKDHLSIFSLILLNVNCPVKLKKKPKNQNNLDNMPNFGQNHFPNVVLI